MLRILCPNDKRDKRHLSQMHQLRYEKFIVELGWKEGLCGINQMEFDCFDHKDTFYLVHLDENDEVDAVARLTQTLYPNLLLDAFKENIKLTEIERSLSVVEISRFCADQIRAPKNVMGLIIGGLLQIGLAFDIKSFVSFSNTQIKPRAEKFGWPANEVGPQTTIGNEIAVALKHEVLESYYKESCRINGIEDGFLKKEEIERCPIVANRNMLMAS